jgi:dolichol kinase
MERSAKNMKSKKRKSLGGIVTAAAMALLAATTVITASGCGVWAHLGFGAG